MEHAQTLERAAIRGRATKRGAPRDFKMAWPPAGRTADDEPPRLTIRVYNFNAASFLPLKLGMQAG
jgi:hypothetical protein